MTTTPSRTAASAVPDTDAPDTDAPASSAPVSGAPGAPAAARTTLRYHRLARADPQHRWWRPLLVGLVGLALYAALLIMVFVPLVVAGIIRPEFAAALDRAFAALDMTEPLALIVMIVMIALMLPAVLLAARLVGSAPTGLLSSVAGRLRWRWMGTAFLVALAVHLPALALAFGIETVTGDLVVRGVEPSRVVALLAITLLIVPFQAAAEEYVFRGYLMQTLGAWLRHPAFAILLPVPLFVLGHDYGVYGAIDVALFAAMCGWLAWRTGGLEAPIAAHVVNNVALMAVNAVGIGDPNATDGTPIGLAISVATMAVFTVVVMRRADRLGVASLRAM